MARLFGRSWSLQVGALELSDLDISFQVTKSVRREPNVAEVRVWNLKAETRAQVEQGGTVLLRAGYEDPFTLFRGDSRTIWSEREGPDYVTVVQARDGGRGYSDTRISRAYQPGTPVVNVVRDVVTALGIGRGNLEEFSSAFALRTGSTTFGDGFVAAGPARRVMNQLTRGAGLRWSVQNGALQLMRRGTPLQTRAIVLSADSGMLESPTWTDARRRRTVSVVSLLQPGLEPGRRVRVESELIAGDFEVREIEYVGDTSGNDWRATLSLRPVT